MKYRAGGASDLASLMRLAMAAWRPFEEKLTAEHWSELRSLLESEKTFVELLQIAHCVVCETEAEALVGMAFVIPSGNPAGAFEAEWSYIRFVSVHPQFSGRGIGSRLTELCIEWARARGEKLIALHTSEMMPGAMHIYARFGFALSRELPPRLGKRYWLYTLDLGPAAHPR